MKRYLKFAASALITLQVASSVHSQDSNPTTPQSRVESIVERQKEKARNLTPPESDRFERILYKYVGDDPLNKYAGGIPGLHLRLGGLPSGSGFSLGTEYLRPDLAEGQMVFRALAVGSPKLWYRIETELRFPNLVLRNLDLQLRGHRLDANSVDYYGPGPESLKTGRTDYRREENGIDVCLTYTPARSYLSIGFSSGYLWLNVGPGKDSEYYSSEKAYPPSVAPGIDTQTDYLRFGPFLEVDSRDKPNDPHSGTHFQVGFNRYSDRKFNWYNFRQIDASLEQYLPFFNEKRVVALRLDSVLSYPGEGSEIPFYMMPTLGGPSSMRGYRRYRFYDNNLFLASVEYRWEVFTLMDAAVFADAGKVFHRDGDFNLKNLESDAGFGFRFKSRESVVFRIDTAFSHEGYGLWFTFDPVF